jgi:hypothetical protein
MIQNLRVGEPFGTSDHQIVRWDFLAGKNLVKKQDTVMYDYFKTNYEQMKMEIEQCNWEDVVKGENVESDWNILKTALIKLRDKYVLLKKQSSNKCKWITKTVTKCRRAKTKAWTK